MKPVVLLALLALATPALAGPLDPPAGPVASTHKTLTEVEPRIAINATNTPGDADSVFKITLPGSYYLTGNVTGVAAKHGIEIAASNVTIDLNGFDLAGVAGSLSGIRATSAQNAGAVSNGTIHNWGQQGLDLAFVNAARVENVTSMFNTLAGISCGQGSVVAGCTARSNGGAGYSLNIGCSITNSSATQNTGIGISTQYGASITGCTAFENGSDGISASFLSNITGCTSCQNTGDGIRTASSCVISNNTCSENDGDGIRVEYQCIVTANTCAIDGNGNGNGAGIHVLFARNRIEGNNCTASDRGIDVDSGGNIIIRNTCSVNATNWDVVAGNIILVVNGAAAGAVLGNAGGVAPGSTDPNANFSY